MTQAEYNKLTWPVRVRMARMALPKSTKTALAKELGTTVHTIVNWEGGKCIPKQQSHRLRIKELCDVGISASSPGLSINFLLGGFDGNETILTQPLRSRDKSAAVLALMAVSIRLTMHIQTFLPTTMFVITADTVFNAYPSYINVRATPIELNGVSFIFRISHLPGGSSYTLELLISSNDEITNVYACDISDSGIVKAVRLLKKFINKLKPNDKRRSRSRIKQ